MEVIPVINCDTREYAVDRLRKAREFSEWVHVDIGNGKFASIVSWGSPEEWQKLLAEEEFKGLNIEFHLMVESPEMVLDSWLRTGAKRVIIHLETMTDSVYILEKCKNYGVEAVLSIGPKTEVERLLAHEHDFQRFQVLAVFPGLQGQKFQEDALEKIKFIREHIPSAIIEVDGGMNLETAKMVKEAGSDIVVSSSYIFGSSNPVESYTKLKNV